MRCLWEYPSGHNAEHLSGICPVEKRGKQRTDSTHVTAAIRTLNRLENLGETLRAALNSIASAAPGWLVQVAEPEWYDRYGKRIEESRLPKGKDKRREYAEIIGVDGMILLEEIYSPERHLLDLKHQ